MKPYIGLVHKEPDSAYGITFPDAPGCFSAADDLDEIFIKAAEGLGAWAEERSRGGLPVPEPRELSVVKSDPQWSRAFALADLVIALAVPSQMRTAA